MRLIGQDEEADEGKTELYAGSNSLRSTNIHLPEVLNTKQCAMFHESQILNQQRSEAYVFKWLTSGVYTRKTITSRINLQTSPDLTHTKSGT